jgi:cytosine deaminase
MHSYPDGYAAKVVDLIAESGMSVVTNPPVNAVLQGRHDGYPRRRGHTRIDELHAAGVPVGVGQDDIVDGWFHYGDGDPLTALYVLLHYAHMHGRGDVDTLWRMLTVANQVVWGDEHAGLAEGAPGSLVVYDSETPFEALRVRPVRPLVLKEGRVVASAEPARKHVHHGGEQQVDGRRESR